MYYSRGKLRDSSRQQTPAIQCAIDCTNLDDAKHIAAAAAAAGVDILEAGTPLITAHGLQAVNLLATNHPDIPIYADLKLIDFSDLEIPAAFDAGASVVSVMIFANDKTISRALTLSRKYKRRVVFSTMGYPLDGISDRVNSIIEMGGQYFVAHGSGTKLSEAFSDFIERARKLRCSKPINLIAAGGITLANIEKTLAFSPHTIIIGRAITSRPDIGVAVERLRAKLKVLTSKRLPR